MLLLVTCFLEEKSDHMLGRPSTTCYQVRSAKNLVLLIFISENASSADNQQERLSEKYFLEESSETKRQTQITLRRYSPSSIAI